MFTSFYLVTKDTEQAQRIKAGASVASALAVCDTYNEARQTAVEYVSENPEIEIYAVVVDPHRPDVELLRRMSWYNSQQVEDAAMFAGAFCG